MTENADATANTNPAPEGAPTTPAEPAPEQAPVQEQPQAPQLNLTPEQAEQWNKFVSSNGGFDSAFSKLKSAVSNPQPKEPEPTPEPAPAPEQPAAPQPQAPARPPEGYITQEEFAAQQYFMSLAGRPEYENIADKISSGEVLKEMAKFNINISENGAYNDRQIRNFLDMYSKTVPAAQTSTAPTNIPTVDYIAVENVQSKDDALAIMQQSMEAKAKGLAEHPKYEEAKKFLQENIFGNK